MDVEATIEDIRRRGTSSSRFFFKKDIVLWKKKKIVEMALITNHNKLFCKLKIKCIYGKVKTLKFWKISPKPCGIFGK